MSIYLHECSKLMRSTAIWGFVILCLGLNLLLVWDNYQDPYARLISSTAYETGVILDDEYQHSLSQINVPAEQRAPFDYLQADTSDAIDVFDTYSTDYIADIYIGATQLTTDWAEKMRAKYASLQQVVDNKAASDESMSLYFASLTYTMHQQLFKLISGWMLTEGGLLLTLLMFLSIGYETIHRTEDVVCSTRTGRRITYFKLLAALSIGLLMYALVCFLTYMLFFQIHDYSAIWPSHVSSLFNYRMDVLTGTRPFITWESFSVKTYFWATLGIRVGVIICFSLLAFIIGILIRHLYLSFFVFLAVNVGMILLPMYISSSTSISLWVKFQMILTPVWLWLKQSLWFTDGDMDIIWPYFEVKGLFASLFILIILCLLSAMHYKRRDLA